MKLLRATHPEAALSVTALSGVLALAVGRGLGTVWVVAAVLAGQLFVGWSNDYLDRERDVRATRVDKPIATGLVPARRVGIGSLVALFLCVPLSLASGLLAGVVHLGAVAAAALYNLGLKATPVSVVPYAVAFAALPAFIVLGLPGHRPPAWLLAAGALIGAGAHFTQVLPDIEDDRRQGLLGLPQRMGPRPATLAAGSLLAAAAIVIRVGPANAPSAAANLALATSLALVAGVLILALMDRRRVAFRLTLVAAAAIVLSFVLSGRQIAG